MKNLNLVKDLPVKQEYHLRLTAERTLKINARQYFQLKTLGIIVDKKSSFIKKAQFTINLVTTKLNSSLRHVVTAGQSIEADSDIVLLIKEELQEYAPYEVARQLRSILGLMIKRYGKAA